MCRIQGNAVTPLVAVLRLLALTLEHRVINPGAQRRDPKLGRVVTVSILWPRDLGYAVVVVGCPSHRVADRIRRGCCWAGRKHGVHEIGVGLVPCPRLSIRVDVEGQASGTEGCAREGREGSSQAVPGDRKGVPLVLTQSGGDIG